MLTAYAAHQGSAERGGEVDGPGGLSEELHGLLSRHVAHLSSTRIAECIVRTERRSTANNRMWCSQDVAENPRGAAESGAGAVTSVVPARLTGGTRRHRKGITVMRFSQHMSAAHAGHAALGGLSPG